MTRRNNLSWGRVRNLARSSSSTSSSSRTASIIKTPSTSSCASETDPMESDDGVGANGLTLEVHPLPDTNEVLLSVHPPKQPAMRSQHTPCDIVLVIDISYSMADEAIVELEGLSKDERTGLSILDLTKHAARTILETLNGNDRLAVVTFSSDAKVVQELIPMTAKNKKETWKRINALDVNSSTNLWHGILEGLKIFDDDIRPGSAPAVMVLTDGEPNHMCPKQGYIPKLRTRDIPVPVHTFGFGYAIRPGLLKSIAEVCGGNYAFIPDAGMIGTIFVHAIANLQTTFATRASITVSGSKGLKLVESNNQYARKDGNDAPKPWETMTIALGNLQYGHSRDILLQYTSRKALEELSVHATLTCATVDESEGMLSRARGLSQPTDLSVELAHYHRTRARMCNFLGSLTPIKDRSERVALPTTELEDKRTELNALIEEVRALNLDDDLNTSLLEDLCGDDPSGQVSLAISSPEYFRRWGIHYLPSLMNAHVQQTCNSFKDPGPLQYGKDSPQFIKCRNKLDEAFDNLPAPTPSITVTDASGQVANAHVPMSRYNNAWGGCFAGECKVRLADGSRVNAQDLRKGTKVWTKKGARAVNTVIVTAVREQEMCKLGDLIITPWHPICVDRQWVFPNDVSTVRETYSGSVISLLLEFDEDSDSHAVEVNGNVVVTLGHGMTQEKEGDARVHAFFGNHELVSKNLGKLPVSGDGVATTFGLRRDESTGLICGFIGQDSH